MVEPFVCRLAPGVNRLQLRGGPSPHRERSGERPFRRKWILALGIAGDVLLLGYYKYANFFVDNLNGLLRSNYEFAHIILPLGVSFFTFTQIAYLVDAYGGLASETNFIHYCLFVSYFPHLIAGPILHHKEMMPQFANPSTYRFKCEHLAIGLTVFAIGLCKKVVLADEVATFATPVCDAAAQGRSLQYWSPGEGRCRILYSCTSISRATATWPSVCRACSAFIYLFILTRPTRQ
jgi:D-alanyl-lipoteichoic acid acyltransferase DltB (MBOAT superfamily)